MKDSISKQVNMGLQLKTVGQLVKLSKGQNALLKVIRNCVETQKPISWDLIVDCYYNNVSKVVNDKKYLGGYMENNPRWEYLEYDAMEIYKKGGWLWQYNLRSRIRSWFVSTIGILVIKNQLIVIPTIEIE